MYLFGKISRKENLIQQDIITNTNDRSIEISCSRGQFHAHILLLTEQESIYSIDSNYKNKSGVNKSDLFTSVIHSSILFKDGRVFT